MTKKEIIIIGLTGGTGCGKSTVSEVFRKSGFEIVDFDKISKMVCDKGSECLIEICQNFGNSILNPDNTLNRKALGAIVFSDNEKLRLLNNITHKYISQKSDEILEKSSSSKFVFDAPLLFEAGLEKKCNCVVSVISDTEKRAERIMARDSISYEYALKRINSQKKTEFYIEKSDYIIYNDTTVEILIENTHALIRDIENKSYEVSSAAKIYGKGVF